MDAPTPDIPPPPPPRSEARGLRLWSCGDKVVYWDNLRKDPELWMEHGDCLVYLYEKGSSRRGASIQSSVARLKEAKCAPLLECLTRRSNPTPTMQQISRAIYNSRPSSPAGSDLFLPAPTGTSRDEAFHYHVTTRNFFAWLHGQPLAGQHLGVALVELVAKMTAFRSCKASNVEDILEYLDRVGYSRMTNRPDHALAVLYLAENLQIRDLWIEAFCHCVGMNDKLHHSTEFENISRVNKALITRAHLKMDLSLSKTSDLINTFLRDELTATSLGLSHKGEQHLNEFMSFLKYYYSSECCFWPPISGETYPLSVYRSMARDFEALYNSLADTNAGGYEIPAMSPSGGVMVLKCIRAFNKNHGFKPLPFSLPILPRPRAVDARYHSYRGVPTLRSTNDEILVDISRNRTSVCDSTVHPSQRAEIKGAAFTSAFKRFESDLSYSRYDRISVWEARKVRWIVIYAMLQVLNAVTNVPPEVREKNCTAYPLSCPLVGLPPWNKETPLTGYAGFQEDEAISLINRNLEMNLTDPPNSTEQSSNGNVETADLGRAVAERLSRGRPEDEKSIYTVPPLEISKPNSNRTEKEVERKPLPLRTSPLRRSTARIPYVPSANSFSLHNSERSHVEVAKFTQNATQALISRVRANKNVTLPSPNSDEYESDGSISSVYPPSTNSSNKASASSASSEEIGTPKAMDTPSFFDFTKEFEPLSKDPVSFVEGENSIRALFIRTP